MIEQLEALKNKDSYHDALTLLTEGASVSNVSSFPIGDQNFRAERD